MSSEVSGRGRKWKLYGVKEIGMPMLRYPIYQHGKVRLIDSGKLLHNRAFAADETIHTTAPSAAAAVAKAFRQRMGKRLSGK